ncbi:class I SAM-dependent methyltransferase [Pannus brasiliensis CCIBt3594]|uniref:Class I SAM-dependent methyltransferase n=1 Tax=Pannus brasiliensis CCIBt3594 TaxID=1427578 RepID=A0AAW9QYC4_9CHRO
MTVTPVSPDFNPLVRLVNGLLSIKPLFDIARYRARKMMIDRAERLGVPWRETVKQLEKLDWTEELRAVEARDLVYPDYYVCSFHAYEKGNLDWLPAFEVESAAYAVHSTIWPGAGRDGDPRLRREFHKVLKEQIPANFTDIVDLGCSVGMSSRALQEAYPDAKITGVDLSPYYLAVANYRGREKGDKITWKHAAAENTGLAAGSFDLVSSFLMFHELPQKASREIFAEARRLLRSNGVFAMMDMNPRSEIYRKMPPYILTLLKSTEPYLDEYFTLDIETALIEAGFESPTITPISPRHRAIVARVR